MAPVESVHVTLADRGDLAAMLALSNDSATRSVANFATAPEPLDAWVATFEHASAVYPWLVAKVGERVVGFARGLSHHVRGAYAWSADVSVYVAYDAHGQRIGTRLYERLLPTLQAQGYATLLAGITVPNPASERLHERFGFVRCATYHRVGWKFGSWRDVGYWELHLHTREDAPQAIEPVHAVWDRGPASGSAGG